MKLKKPFSDGTTHIVFTPLEFIEKLSALVPKPRVHLIRYAGAFARHAKIRPDVLVKARLGEEAAATEKDKSTPAPESKTPVKNHATGPGFSRKSSTSTSNPATLAVAKT